MSQAKQRGHLVSTNDPNDPIAIRVEHVSKSFKLPHSRQNSIKGGLINLFNGDRSYETQEVLKDVSFEIKKGEFFGIVGRNGSGKSTLLKMLAGIYTPSSGKIIVNGSLTPFIELGVGFNPELTGRENVFLNGALLGFNRDEMAEMYDDIVDFAELERFMDQKLKNYSSGMQVRLAFSIAIRAQSDILLLDEVLAVGDEAFQRKCYGYFKALKEAKKTVIIVSHDMGAIQEFCTRAMLIEAGEKKYEGNPLLVAAEYRLLNGEQVPEAPTEEEDKAVDKVELSFDESIKEVLINDKKKAVISKDINEISIKIIPQSSRAVTVGLSIVRVDDHYVGFHNTAEQIGKIEMRPSIELTLKYTVDISDLMPGTYRLDCATYDKDGNYVDLKISIAQFVVTGSDETRGGILRLKGNWELA